MITDEEKENILEDETHSKTRIYKYIPEYIWPQVESDKQLLTSNEKLITLFESEELFPDIEVLGTYGRELFHSCLESFHQQPT